MYYIDYYEEESLFGEGAIRMKCAKNRFLCSYVQSKILNQIINTKQQKVWYSFIEKCDKEN